jgi:hypothetical protein
MTNFPTTIDEVNALASKYSKLSLKEVQELLITLQTKLGVNNSLDVNTLDYLVRLVNSTVHIVAEHLHNKNRFLGSRDGWDGSNTVNAAINSKLTPFTLVSGNNTYGPALCILGSGDTPVQSGKTYFDHRCITVTSAGGTGKYRIRFAWGATYNAAIAADNFTEFEFMPISAASDSGTQPIEIPRLPVGTILWCSIWCLGQNAQNLLFTTGVHEYDD